MRTNAICLVVTIILSIHSYRGHSQTGVLDKTFGINGKVVTPPPMINNVGAAINDIKIQPDGKIVAVGGAGSLRDSSGFFVIRYNQDGSLDNTFGNGGITLTQINARNKASAKSVVIQPDGKIVVGGYTSTGTYSSIYQDDVDYVLARYNSNGSLDSTFGTTGFIIGEMQFEQNFSYSLALRPNGNALLGVEYGLTTAVQLTPNGTYDTTYMTPYNGIDPNDIVVLNDGKVLVGGGAFMVIKFNSDGTLAPNFGGLSAAGIPFPLMDSSNAYSIIVQPDGKIVMAGKVFDGTRFHVGLVRINSNGAPDSTFGLGGQVITTVSSGNDIAKKIHLQSDGKFLVTGTTSFSHVATSDSKFLVLRYNSNGTVDSSFGRHGSITTDFSSSADEAFTSAIQLDGKIVVAGRTFQNGIYSLAIARYERNSTSNYNTIIGSVFLDNNSNGIKDITEPYYTKANIVTTKPGIVPIQLHNSNGAFSIDIDTGSYTTTIIPYSPYYTGIPSVYTNSNNTFLNTDSVTFAIQPIPGKRDVAVSLIPITVSRPGFETVYKITYTNEGTETITNGNIRFLKSSKLTYNTATPVPSSINGDTLIWNYVNLNSNQTSSIEVNFSVAPPPIANLNDTLKSTVLINPLTSDLAQNNNIANLNQLVVGSFDPNDKTERHAGKVTTTEVAAGDYLEYTIRFQNTGTDTAFNVYIRDTLSNHLDWSTFQMVNTSHNFDLHIKEGSQCMWTFKNINLVDSNKNEKLSHGYINYKIKPKANTSTGTMITNQAAIYFDYNLPVYTNVETTTVTSESFPLKLLAFTALRAGKDNLLQWQTGQEKNVDGFEIERSADSRDYLVIGGVKSGALDYTFKDTRPFNGKNYYRLKIVDKDRKFEYSPVRLVNGERSFSVNIYPNPVKNSLHLFIDADKQKFLQLQVLSQDGKIHFSEKQIVSEGRSMHSLNINSLSSGVYFLKINSLENEQSIIKFEKF